MIIPLLITGILFGYILRAKKSTMSRRFMSLGTLLGGVGNAVNAAILYLSQNQARTGPGIPSFARQAAPTQTPISFLLLSFIVGVLVVLLVLIPAVLVQTRTFPHLSFMRFPHFSFRRGGKTEP
jgi:RsiW-degrading membrane proteinase PrsW (M82 family)